MGVPALFRWLNTKYPKITTKVIEEQSIQIAPNQPPIPVDLSKPNPNGWEVDNLYLDMNGIVHPCTHPEDKPPPKNEDEAMIEIFKYLDRIMAMVRPRKVLYMAIDGVAPRAKMNQQRSRRFRAAQEAAAQQVAEEKIREELRAAGRPVVAPEDRPDRFDSNCITPGTPFMHRLAECLRYYIAERLNSSTGWANVKIILSDASVPGEGEHKIMDFIRHQRASPRHDPNTKHVLYGLDADLIMLALATHEPHFRILREDVFSQDTRGKGCFICGQEGHQAADCTGQISAIAEKKVHPVKPFIFLHVNILREYLEYEMKIPNLPFKFNLERAIDDWVFMCFFVGNDFLPHLPSLEIREAAIDTLISIWKRNLGKMGGYMSENGVVHLDRLQIMMEELGEMENEIFRKRREAEERRIAGAKRREEQREQGSNYRQQLRETKVKPEKMGERMHEFGRNAVSVKDREKMIETSKAHVKEQLEKKAANLSAAQALRASLAAGAVIEPASVKSNKRRIEDTEESQCADLTDSDHAAKKEKVTADGESVVTEPALKDNALIAEESVEEESSSSDGDDEDIVDDAGKAHVVKVILETDTKEKIVVVKKPEVDNEEPVDEVRLWEDGWRERYYESKFGVAVTDIAMRKKLVHAYVEGLCWVLQYYYQGCQSWKWFYPYHYAPFASDFPVTELIKELEIKFEKSTPFQPMEQLMGVLPAGSKDHIPSPFHPLMTHPDSEIIDFYPTDFRIDLNGKKYAWQGVALLPFIDEKRLRDAMRPVYEQLAPDQLKLNRLGNDVIFVGQNHALYEYFSEFFGAKRTTEPVSLSGGLSARFAGEVLPDNECVLPGSVYFSPLIEYGLDHVEGNNSIDMLYFNPKLPRKDYIFPATLLPGVKFSQKVLQGDDALSTQRGGQPHRHRNAQSQQSSYNQPPPRDYDRRELPPQDYRNDRGRYQNADYNNRQYPPGNGYDDRRPYSGYNTAYQERPHHQQQQNYNGREDDRRRSDYSGYSNAPYRNPYPQPSHQQNHYQPPPYALPPSNPPASNYGPSPPPGHYPYAMLPAQNPFPGAPLPFGIIIPPPMRPPVNLAWQRNMANNNNNTDRSNKPGSNNSRR